MLDGPAWKRLLGGYIFVLTGNGIAGLMSFLISVLLSRKMGVGEFGSYGLFFTLLTLVWQIPGFIDSAYVRYARAAAPEEADDYLRVNLAFKARAWVCIIAAGPVAAYALSRWLFPGKASFGLLLMAFAGGAFLTFLASVLANLQAREAYAGYSLANILFYGLALAVLFVLSRRAALLTPKAAAIVFLTAAVLTGTGAFVWLARKARPLRLLGPLNPAAAGKMRSLGRWILWTGLLFIVLQRIDMMIVGHFFTAEEVGVYTAASRLLAALTVFLTAAMALYLPKASLAPGSAAAWRSYKREAALLTGIILIILAGLVAAAPLMVSIFYGQAYAGAAAATRALFLGHIPQALALPVSYLLYGLEDSFSNFLAMALALAANLAANVILTPRLGVTGPGWSFGVGYTVYLIACVGALYWRRENRERLERVR